MKDGPQLNFGFNDVDYPFNDGSYAASLRIGLPQLKKLRIQDSCRFLFIVLLRVMEKQSLRLLLSSMIVVLLPLLLIK